MDYPDQFKIYYVLNQVKCFHRELLCYAKWLFCTNLELIATTIDIDLRFMCEARLSLQPRLLISTQSLECYGCSQREFYSRSDCK
jgi:hypothetical protein